MYRLVINSNHSRDFKTIEEAEKVKSQLIDLGNISKDAKIINLENCFVYEKNRYGYNKVIVENLSIDEAITKAKKESALAWKNWNLYNSAHNSRYEVYSEGDDPDVDNPVFSIK